MPRPSSSHVLRGNAVRVLAAAVLALLGALPSGAQGNHRISVHADDSVSFIVPRRPPASGEASLRTTDRRAALILRDTVVVLQLTDRGMDELFDGDTATRSLGEGILVRMTRAGITGLLDHGIAYRLSALRRAYADGSRLVLEDHAGNHVFESTEYNGRHPMEEFVPAEAAHFAAAVQRLIATRR